MKTLVALYNSYMVAGGIDLSGGFGYRNINSRVGVLWKNGRCLAELDKSEKAILEAMRASIKINAKLDRCK